MFIPIVIMDPSFIYYNGPYMSGYLLYCQTQDKIILMVIPDSNYSNNVITVT